MIQAPRTSQVPREPASGALVCPEPAERPDLWPWTAQRRDDGVLEVGGVAMTQVDHPLFVLDTADLEGRARVWVDAMHEEFWDGYGLAGGDVFYAAKAFLSADVARAIAAAGMGVDTASLGELMLALDAGVDAARIGLHGNGKSDVEIATAIRNSIARIVIDSPGEVAQIAGIAAEVFAEGGATMHGRPREVPVMVRIKTGVHAGGHEFIATSHEDQKFGLSIADGQARDVVRAIAAEPHLRLVGLHSHIGSQILDTAAFGEAARRVLEFRAELEHDLGILIPEVDLGGGMGVAYTGKEPPALSVADVTRSLAKAVREDCEELGVSVPHVSIEPGRSVIAPSMITLYGVRATKDVTLEGGTRRYVSVDGGMSDNIRPALYRADYTATLANRTPRGPWVRSRVVGKHCESGDIICHDVDLPEDVRVGDLLAVPVTGAYGRSMASNYNMALMPGVLMVKDGESHFTIRPQTLGELLKRHAGQPI